MFDDLLKLRELDPTRFVVIVCGLAIIFAGMLWISIIDIKRKSITFWKVLIVASLTILVPFVASFFCGCGKLKWFVIASFIPWFFLLFINIKFNREKIIGKADVDLLSAVFSELLMCSMWIKCTQPKYFFIRVTKLFYTSFLYILLGSLIFMGILFAVIMIKRAITGESVFAQLRKTKISAIPMFIPFAVMVPFDIMMF